MTLSIDVARKYLNDTFVETGTYDGGAVQIALCAGYKTIYSMEADENLYNTAKARFAKLDQVHIYLGDTGTDLAKILDQLTGKATFWLDAHPIYGGNSPLLKELYQIALHPIKNHTIMIDDRTHLAGFYLTEHEVVNAIRLINQDYKIEYAPNNIHPEDILVAYI
jgi:predicted O-methyltransferase YrrM